MLPYSNTANVPDLGYLTLLSWLSDEETARQRAVATARMYHNGEQLVRLTDRLVEFLGVDTDSLRLRLNVCRTVVAAVVERLTVQAITAAGKTEGETKAQREWLTTLWQQNKLDARQDSVHQMTIRDGEAFVLVAWDAARKMARLYPQPRYVAADIEGGDGYGCRAFYENDDPDQDLRYVTKHWIETTVVSGSISQRRRLTIYHPDRVEKYEWRKGWEPLQEPGDTAWPIPWIDAKGEPLGIPVVHFTNADMACEAWEAIPLQKAVNKTLVDLLAASDTTAFRILIALGWEPVDSAGEPLRINPGQWVGTKDKGGSVEAIDPADLSGLIALLQGLVQWTAMVTDTPPSRFQVSGQVAAEGTLKEQEAPLISKVEKRQVLLGNAWEQVAQVARVVRNAFSGEAPLDPDAYPDVQWAPAAPRSEAEVRADLEFKKLMGVPTAEIWREMGYSDDQIKTMLAMRDAAAGTTPIGAQA